MLELLVVVLVLGILAAIIVPRISVTTSSAEQNVQAHHIAHLNQLVETYHTENGSWPAALADLAPTYLPDGVPTPPSGGSYTLNGASHRVEHTP